LGSYGVTDNVEYRRSSTDSAENVQFTYEDIQISLMHPRTYE